MKQTLAARIGAYKWTSTVAGKIMIALTLTVLSVIGRIALVGVPNVQPSTVIIFIASLTLGTRYGLGVAIGTVLGSNLELGHGPWTMWQICAWGTVAIGAGLIRPIYQKMPMYVLIGLAALAGYVYGFMVSLPAWAMGPAGFWTYYKFGLLFDTFHAAGNAVIFAILAPILLKRLSQVDRDQI